jgi:methyl-accepting chemotaxis protein
MQTSENMEHVNKISERTSESMQEINDSSVEQRMAISDIMVNINQISQVVQSNSATAEESAAAAEELSAQSQMLEDEVSRFKLRDNRERRDVVARRTLSHGSVMEIDLGNNKY